MCWDLKVEERAQLRHSESRHMDTCPWPHGGRTTTKLSHKVGRKCSRTSRNTFVLPTNEPWFLKEKNSGMVLPEGAHLPSNESAWFIFSGLLCVSWVGACSPDHFLQKQIQQHPSRTRTTPTKAMMPLIFLAAVSSGHVSEVSLLLSGRFVSVGVRAGAL